MSVPRLKSAPLVVALLLAFPLSAAAAPDLTVHQLQISPTEPALGESVEVKATIKNIGDSSVGDFLCIGGDIPVHFFHNGELIAEEQLSCGLDPDETDAEIAKVIVDSLGLQTFEVIVDPDGDIDESDESNNVATLEVTPVDSAVEVTHNLPAVGAPGLEDVIVTVHVTNNGQAKIKDVYVWLELLGETGPLDFGNTQGSDLSPGETHTWETELNYGLDVTFGELEPGDYQWKFQVFQHALPPKAESVALTAEAYSDMTISPAVEVNEDNIVVPNVDPVAEPTGQITTFTAHDVKIDGELYSVSLGFAVPVDFLADSSWTIFSRVHALQVTDATGLPVCDVELRKKAAQAVLLWRDLIVEHPWYQGTYIALQEGFDWYYDEKNLKVVFYITQPFVIVKEFLQELVTLGTGLTDWVKAEMGFTTPAETEVGTLTFKVTSVITKGFDTAGVATQQIVKLSPLLAGEPYLSDHVISEALLNAIEAGGDDFDQAVDLVHELIKEDSPDRYTKIKQVIPVGLILGSIGSTLLEGVKEVLWTAVKRGFTAYFISKLTAKTAWKVALGEGKAVLMSGLTAAGIAKGIASLGLTLIMDISIAYLTYVGTFVDNVRGPGGLIEAGQAVAQSIPWTHVLYSPEGGAEPLDADVVDDTFMAHAVMYEVYGFILSDLAMLKKLAFAKEQAKSYLDDSLAMFGVSKSQREFAVALQTTATLLANSTCEGAKPLDPENEAFTHEPPPRRDETADDEEPEGRQGWTKPRARPDPSERGNHPPVRWIEHSDETFGPPDIPPPPAVEVETSSCTTADRGAAGAWWLLLITLVLLRRREAAS